VPKSQGPVGSGVVGTDVVLDGAGVGATVVVTGVRVVGLNVVFCAIVPVGATVGVVTLIGAAVVLAAVGCGVVELKFGAAVELGAEVDEEGTNVELPSVALGGAAVVVSLEGAIVVFGGAKVVGITSNDFVTVNFRDSVQRSRVSDSVPVSVRVSDSGVSLNVWVNVFAGVLSAVQLG
jgi:hypothetical protein